MKVVHPGRPGQAVGCEPVSVDREIARLNFGDCLSYGLARHLAEPLLLIGGDFAKTDVTPALAG